MSSALKPAGSTRRWRQICARVFARDGRRCLALRDGVVCGARATTVGHKRRREHGGNDELSNLQPQCGDCNYGEVVTDAPSGPPRMTPIRQGIAVILDRAGLPYDVGRRRAREALDDAHPGLRWRSADIDAACRWRRWRGPLIRL